MQAPSLSKRRFGYSRRVSPCTETPANRVFRQNATPAVAPTEHRRHRAPARPAPQEPTPHPDRRMPPAPSGRKTTGQGDRLRMWPGFRARWSRAFAGRAVALRCGACASAPSPGRLPASISSDPAPRRRDCRASKAVASAASTHWANRRMESNGGRCISCSLEACVCLGLPLLLKALRRSKAMSRGVRGTSKLR